MLLNINIHYLFQHFCPYAITLLQLNQIKQMISNYSQNKQAPNHLELPQGINESEFISDLSNIDKHRARLRLASLNLDNTQVNFKLKFTNTFIQFIEYYVNSSYNELSQIVPPFHNTRPLSKGMKDQIDVILSTDVYRYLDFQKPSIIDPDVPMPSLPRAFVFICASLFQIGVEYKRNLSLSDDITIPSSLDFIQKVERQASMRNIVPFHALFFKLGVILGSVPKRYTTFGFFNRNKLNTISIEYTRIQSYTGIPSSSMMKVNSIFAAAHGISKYFYALGLLPNEKTLNDNMDTDPNHYLYSSLMNSTRFGNSSSSFFDHKEYTPGFSSFLSPLRTLNDIIKLNNDNNFSIANFINLIPISSNFTNSKITPQRDFTIPVSNSLLMKNETFFLSKVLLCQDLLVPVKHQTPEEIIDIIQSTDLTPETPDEQISEQQNEQFDPAGPKPETQILSSTQDDIDYDTSPDE